MTRVEKRRLAKTISKMDQNQMYEFLTKMCENHAKNVIEVAMKVLNKEFGFGKKRKKRFEDALNILMTCESEE